MSCSCGGNHSNLLCSLQQMTSDVLMGLQDSGVLTTAFNKVELLYITSVNSRPFAGDPGQSIQQKVEILPTPIVTNVLEPFIENSVYNEGRTAVQRTGMAKIKNIVASDKENPSAGYNLKQLETANFWLINDQQYDLVAGSLKRMPSGVFWEAIVIKSRTNGL